MSNLEKQIPDEGLDKIMYVIGIYLCYFFCMYYLIISEYLKVLYKSGNTGKHVWILDKQYLLLKRLLLKSIMASPHCDLVCGSIARLSDECVTLTIVKRCEKA